MKLLVLLLPLFLSLFLVNSAEKDKKSVISSQKVVANKAQLKVSAMKATVSNANKATATVQNQKNNVAAENLKNKANSGFSAQALANSKKIQAQINAEASQEKEFAFLGALKDKTWIYDAKNGCPSDKKGFSKTEKAPGNKIFEKNKIVNIKIFTLPPSNAVAVILDKIYKDLFKKEIDSAYNSFKTEGDILTAQIKKGFATNKWQITGDLDEFSDYIFTTYDVDGKTGLNEQEFAFMAIDNVYSYKQTFECNNCLKDLRLQIGKFFDFIDCDSSGYVQARDLHTVLSHIATSELTTTAVNDWLLKEDLKQIGRLGREQFVHALLRTLYESAYL